MTIFFPDVSHYQSGLVLKSDNVALIAKATEGSTYKDPAYAGFKSQANSKGMVFMAYHWIHGSSDAEVNWVYKVVGKTPLMIDMEESLSVATIKSFVTKYRAKGGVCNMVYYPHWRWQSNGSPSLTPLSAIGMKLVSSNYTSYSANGPGWAGYGGMNPVQWQYSDNFNYSGYKIDFNAYKGTVAQYAAMIGAAAPTPTPSNGGDTTTAITDADAEKIRDTVWRSGVLRRSSDDTHEYWAQTELEAAKVAAQAAQAAAEALSASGVPVTLDDSTRAAIQAAVTAAVTAAVPAAVTSAVEAAFKTLKIEVSA